MKFTLTGTGTSQGVPVIGCQCAVCKSSDPRDNRLRTAAFIEANDVHIAIDAGPDFRQQMLAVGAISLDAVLITHEHNDHIAGLDDVRPFNFRQRREMKLYALSRVADDIQHRFSYVFSKNPYPGAPRIDIEIIKPFDPLQVKDLSILPLSVYHGKMEVLGFRINDLTYITDAKHIPEETQEKVRGSKVLILNALHHRPHYSHFNLEEAIEMSKVLGAEMTYLTHVSHDMGLYEEIAPKLPSGIQLAYDGLSFKL